MPISSISPPISPQARRAVWRFAAAFTTCVFLMAEAIAGPQGAMSLQPISTRVQDRSATVAAVQPGFCLVEGTSRDSMSGKADDPVCQRSDVRPDVITGKNFLVPQLENVDLKLSPQLGSPATIRNEADNESDPPISTMLSACLALMWIVAWRRFRSD